ncbi:MAG: LON peptidase substrate-binding domain-containing protein, partial [Gammaproteobacteria bacterium]|nr:LON peptidase substrate-binding domain-containing protein [Gammaproteobacteria bacterium]MBT5444408.1 LON peptidase substrate-binding domain-containing protein [Gammaproteobacteria bacterium]MBT6571171.1 LON peptidase substrate-binding domain-containing protein [Gammaproteobacteria bacterium]MBT6666424.1 LON peptidase substrate-binding domain-containing protein [Gammaproteobacteria bacterium]MBT7796624.1 LON peptidase substrate-binding domain-containing protein [Gammaproteobacteria bacterium
LFPIPGMVAFPGTIVPLHVFEPRYRQMVTDAVEQNRMIAVCHTKKEIRPAKDGQSMQDALKNNQATYQPVEVFSAGICEIIDTTADGRVYIHISMSKRLQLVHEVQTLPYRIVACSELEDVSQLASDDELMEYQTSITDSIVRMIGKHNPAKLSEFNSDEWLELSPIEFSFKVFQLVRFDADTMQSILEVTSNLERLKMVASLVHSGEA